MKQLTLFIAAILFSFSLIAQERGYEIVPVKDKCLALIIGNGTYESGGSLGNQPINDANDMKHKLQKLGFDVMILTNASKRQMDEKINEFGKKLPAYCVGLIFYAGHGLQVNNQNYLVPVDAVIESESDVPYTCVPAGRMLGKMNDAQNDLNIVILDACRNNPFERKWTGRSIGEPGNGLAKMDAPKGTLISYATSPGKTASNGTGRNGLYTSVLLKYIDMPGLKLEDVFKEVRTEVYNSSDTKQLPWESTSIMGNFYFAGKGNKNKTNTDDIVINVNKAKGTIKLVSKISGDLIIDKSNKGKVNSGDVLTFDVLPGEYSLRIGNWKQIVQVESHKTTTVTALSKDLPNRFTDYRNQKTYKTVRIGTQVWMAENLAYNTGSGCWAFDNNESNAAKYGYLYNWETAQNVCPIGWHLPSDNEWEQLAKYISEKSGPFAKRGTHWTELGKYLKATRSWSNSKDKNGNGNNNYGFEALATGYREANGSFSNFGGYTYFWSSSEKNSSDAWIRILYYHGSEFRQREEMKESAISVRCVKD